MFDKTEGKFYHKKTLRKGQILFREGEPGDSLYYVQYGALKVFVLNPNGREKILALLGPGELLGEMAIIDDKPRSAAAQALERSEVLVFDKTSFFMQIKEDPALAFDLIMMLIKRLRHTDAQLMDQVSNSARQRIGKSILDLAEKFGHKSTDGLLVNLRLTHQDLASYSGVARETATRVLQDLLNEELLIINTKKQFVIPNISLFKEQVFEYED